MQVVTPCAACPPPDPRPLGCAPLPPRRAVSSLQRSAVLINPDLPEAVALRQWWDTTGHSEATTHVGEGLESAIK